MQNFNQQPNKIGTLSTKERIRSFCPFWRNVNGLNMYEYSPVIVYHILST